MSNRTKRWNAIFDFYDTNDDGLITKDDIMSTFERLFELKGIDPASALAAEIRAGAGAIVSATMSADLDGDGKVTRDEWHTFYTRELGRAGGEMLPSAGLLRFGRLGFRAFDLNGDGMIDRSDYAGCAKILNVKATQAELDRHFEVIAKRYGDGERMDPDGWMSGFIEIWCTNEDVPFWYPAR